MSVWIIVVSIVFVILAFFAASSYRTVPQNQVLILRGLFLRAPRVCWDKALVFPVIHDAKLIDMQDRFFKETMAVEDSCICRDGIKADLQVAFAVHPDRKDKSLIALAERYAPEELAVESEKFLRTAFRDSIRRAMQELDFEKAQNLDDLESAIQKKIEKKHLNEAGFLVHNISIEYFRQCPMAEHDLLDLQQVEGLAKIDKQTKQRILEAQQRELDLESTRIHNGKVIELLKIHTEREVEKQRIAKEEEINQARFDKLQHEIQAKRDLEVEKIGAAQKQELEEENKTRAVRLSQLDRSIQVADRERDLGEAIEAKLQVDTRTATAEEALATARTLARAEREIDELSIRDRNAIELDAFRTLRLAQAKQESAKLDLATETDRAEGIERIGMAEGKVLERKLEAGNRVEHPQILLEALRELAPRLPEIIEKAMIPAEQIDSIKILNIDGLGPRGTETPEGLGSVEKLITILMGTGIALPAFKLLLGQLGDGSFLNELLAKKPGDPSDVRLEPRPEEPSEPTLPPL